MTEVSHRVVLKFPHRLVDQPIVFRLAKDYRLEFNILKAYVTPEEEGLLVLELKGEKKDYDQGVKYVAAQGVKVEPLSQDIVWKPEKCTHCGVCVPLCPSGALVMDINSHKVEFLEDKCIACELCIPACPVRAIEVHF